ncbi:MAG: DUF3276 family protein [Treponema sp.]|nr:DUF3276 family protein [Treponema sp.]
MGIRGELYTTQVQVNNRSYFFNVKENRNGDVFLQVVESKISDGEDDRRAIVIFEDNMKDFLGGLEDSLRFIEKNRKEQAKARAEKKSAKEARYKAMAAEERGEDLYAGKKVYRRKGESRLVAQKRAERDDMREPDGIKRSGRVLHVKSKREVTESTEGNE